MKIVLKITHQDQYFNIMPRMQFLFIDQFFFSQFFTILLAPRVVQLDPSRNDRYHMHANNILRQKIIVVSSDNFDDFGSTWIINVVLVVPSDGTRFSIMNLGFFARLQIFRK